MPRKRKPAIPERQAPPPAWNTAAFAEQMRAVAEQLRAALGRYEFKHPPLVKMLEEYRRRPVDPADKPRQRLSSNLDQFSELAALRQLRAPDFDTEPVPSAKPKQTKPRVLIPHADEAIEQMLAERKADPRKFRLVKTQRERVREILKDDYGVMVPKSQNRTLERRIRDLRDKPGR
jgi:hypothetical protein